VGLQFRRGTAADVTSETFIPAIGEPLYVTDEEKLYIGDGATVGGNIVGGADDLKDLSDVHLTTQDVRAIQSYTVSSNTVTINTTTGNPYKVDQQVTISNAAVTVLNGTHTINSTPTANQFTFVLTTADVSNTVTTGTITPVIPGGALLAFNTTNNRFEDKTPSAAIGVLSNHTDVDSYDTSGSYTDLGKVLRLDTDNQWSVKRPGESVRLTSGQHFFGNDFANGATQNVYTGNEASWTEDSGNTNTDLHSASPGSIPAPPYGDAAYDSTSHDYDPVGSFVDSNDFTLDFWLYIPTGASATEEAMLFYGPGGYPHFVPRVSTTSLQIESAAQPDGTVGNFSWPVVQWSGWSSTVDKWTHYSVVRKGNEFRLWVDGDDKGSGTLGTQYTYAVSHNFKFSSISSFYSIQYENDGVLIGPHYFDLKKAHRDPLGGDIHVPIERVDFNNERSGVNLVELKDVTQNSFVDGDVLTYHQGLWTVNKALYGRLYYSQATAPTGTVQYSDRIGSWTGLTGQWRDMTYANTTSNDGQGPYSTAADPTLLLQDSVSGTSMISGLPKGIVRIDLEADFVLNNLSANSYNAHWLEILWQDGSTDVDSRTHFVFPAHTATSTAITITQKTSVIAYNRAYNSGFIECNIDQEQNADYYISRAILSVTKIG
tara:strand:- start:43 stop:2010 length:1968 start_codon:yes stop_codon:yes gene_type:complete